MPDATGEFFAPLRDLRIGDARIYLGVVLGDGSDAFVRRAVDAGRYLPRFGIASYCGWGREDPDRVPALLADLRECCEIFATMDMEQPRAESRASLIVMAASPRDERCRSMLVRLSWIVQRVAVIHAGGMHALMEPLVGSFEGGAELTEPAPVGSRRDGVHVGDRPLDLVQHGDRVGFREEFLIRRQGSGRRWCGTRCRRGAGGSSREHAGRSRWSSRSQRRYGLPLRAPR